MKLLESITLKKLFLSSIILVSTAACSSNQPATQEKTNTAQEAATTEKATATATVYASSEAELSKEKSIFIDEKNKVVKVYATVNGKYLVEPTRHGLNWVDGAYGDQAVLKAYANPTEFYGALMKIGGTPAVEKGGDASKEFEVTPEGNFIKGDDVNVSITWKNAGKDYNINDVMIDSSGKNLDYHFGGNYDAASKKETGCYMCFDSCPVGITSNSSHPTGTFQDGKAEFHGNPDVLPADGTEVVLTYSFNK